MATSKCPKCESTGFELKLNEPKGSNFKIYFVQCATCGAVVGVKDFYDIGMRIESLANALNVRLPK